MQDKTTKQPRLNCRNWECGVILPLVADQSSSGSGTGTMHLGEKTGLAIFDPLVPVPIRYPGERLEGKKPWTMFD